MISKLSFNALMEVLSPNYCGTHCICDWRAGRPIRRCMDFVSIFAALVVGLILEPMPPAFIGMIAITLAVLFRVGMPVVEKARKIVPTTAGQAGASAVSPMPSYG